MTLTRNLSSPLVYTSTKVLLMSLWGGEPSHCHSSCGRSQQLLHTRSLGASLDLFFIPWSWSNQDFTPVFYICIYDELLRTPGAMCVCLDGCLIQFYNHGHGNYGICHTCNFILPLAEITDTGFAIF